MIKNVLAIVGTIVVAKHAYKLGKALYDDHVELEALRKAQAQK